MSPAMATVTPTSIDLLRIQVTQSGSSMGSSRLVPLTKNGWTFGRVRHNQYDQLKLVIKLSCAWPVQPIGIARLWPRPLFLVGRYTSEQPQMSTRSPPSQTKPRFCDPNVNHTMCFSDLFGLGHLDKLRGPPSEKKPDRACGVIEEHFGLPKNVKPKRYLENFQTNIAYGQKLTSPVYRLSIVIVVS
ncbi:hypothetical protein BDM02DRAFT_1241484 [Thelephora ganbajun]|uniref:Uncharacterized protein n=1 Tax=Thelephora ganbajun TaxID=370292 RepID=A0ACB6Z3V0_THEGA|nr:hypothetical protein BDM02DRAFT_1241484 [Thelephora ganbajun]